MKRSVKTGNLSTKQLNSFIKPLFLNRWVGFRCLGQDGREFLGLGVRVAELAQIFGFKLAR